MISQRYQLAQICDMHLYAGGGRQSLDQGTGGRMPLSALQDWRWTGACLRTNGRQGQVRSVDTDAQLIYSMPSCTVGCSQISPLSAASYMSDMS